MLAVVGTTALTWGVNRALDSSADAIEDTPEAVAHVEADPARVFAGQPEWQTYDLVAAISRQTLSAPPSLRCREWRSWARQFGGVDADETHAYVYLQRERPPRS